MPFDFSAEETERLVAADRCIEDRRNNPIPGRRTKFRLNQQNMLAYTFPFVPGFAPSGVNSMSFKDLVRRATQNARREGDLFYRRDFEVASNAVAKVEGDIFEALEAAIHWNAAARWNRYMATDTWETHPRYPRPLIEPSSTRQVAVLSLPRGYDWVRLLAPDAQAVVAALRRELQEHGLSLPTSTPDMLVVVLPRTHQRDERFGTELTDLSRTSQATLRHAHQDFAGRVAAGEFILAVALKKSLRSDRLYQPLYEANVMQLLLEGRLAAPQVDFEVHTLESAGTRAETTYSAASLSLVATEHASPHRAVRALYEPPSASEVVRRFLTFLNVRMAQVA